MPPSLPLFLSRNKTPIECWMKAISSCMDREEESFSLSLLQSALMYSMHVQCFSSVAVVRSKFSTSPQRHVSVHWVIGGAKWNIEFHNCRQICCGNWKGRKRGKLFHIRIPPGSTRGRVRNMWGNRNFKTKKVVALYDV